MIQNSLRSIGFIFLICLSGCQNVSVEPDDEDFKPRWEKRDKDMGTLFDDDALSFGAKHPKGTSPYLGVNEYLWHATLEVLSFLPLRFVDPFAGVIATDWYQFEGSPNERIKIDVLILDKKLSVNALKVSIHQQTKSSGSWIYVATHPQTVRQLEDVILTKARSLKSNTKL